MAIRLKNLKTFSLAQSDSEGWNVLMPDDALLWARYDNWTCFEACLLLAGINPESWRDRVKSHPAMMKTEEYKDIDPPELQKRLECICRAGVRSRQFEISTKPIEFLLWAQRFNLAVPEEFSVYILEHVLQIPVWEGREVIGNGDGNNVQIIERWVYEPFKKYLAPMSISADAASNDTGSFDHAKAVTSLTKMVAGMAIGQFEYSPNKGRNNTGAIRSALERAGLSMDQGTIKSIIDQCISDLDLDISVFEKSA